MGLGKPKSITQLLLLQAAVCHDPVQDLPPRGLSLLSLKVIINTLFLTQFPLPLPLAPMAAGSC